MPGVTDSKTVFGQLRSVFPRSPRDHFIFRLFTRFTPTLFLILAGLIFWQRMVKEHINCYAPQDDTLRPSAVNQYCFATGTYTVIGCDVSNRRAASPYPGICPKTPEAEVKHHLYFQWVPFIFLIQAILFILPNKVWTALFKDTISRYCQDIDFKKGGDEGLERSANRFIRNVRHQASYARGFLFCEGLNLLIVFASFLLSNALLDGQFVELGTTWIRYAVHQGRRNLPEDSSMKNPLEEVFPKMSKCEFKKFGPGGSIINYDLLCVMSLNVLHDKVFLFQWFWFWTLFVMQLLNLVLNMLTRYVKGIRMGHILKKIEPTYVESEEGDDDTRPASVSDFEIFKTDVKKFLAALDYDDWFILKAVANGTDSHKFTLFMKTLIKLSHIKDEPRNDQSVMKGEKVPLLVNQTALSAARQQLLYPNIANHEQLNRMMGPGPIEHGHYRSQIPQFFQNYTEMPEARKPIQQPPQYPNVQSTNHPQNMPASANEPDGFRAGARHLQRMEEQPLGDGGERCTASVCPGVSMHNNGANNSDMIFLKSMENIKF